MKFPLYLNYEDSDIRISLELNSLHTFITGNSATGKSYICKKLDALKVTPVLQEEVKVNFNWDALHICFDIEDVRKISNINNSIVILDRLDFYCNGEVIEFIKSTNNIFIFMSRYGIKGVYTTYKNSRMLKTERIGDKLNVITIPSLSNEAVKMLVSGCEFKDE